MSYFFYFVLPQQNKHLFWTIIASYTEGCWASLEIKPFSAGNTVSEVRLIKFSLLARPALQLKVHFTPPSFWQNSFTWHLRPTVMVSLSPHIILCSFSIQESWHLYEIIAEVFHSFMKTNYSQWVCDHRSFCGWLALLTPFSSIRNQPTSLLTAKLPPQLPSLSTASQHTWLKYKAALGFLCFSLWFSLKIAVRSDLCCCAVPKEY